MQTIFCAFTTYPEADDAVRQLQESDFDMAEINALVHDGVAKAHMDENNLARVHVDVTDQIGEQELSGLALLVGNEQPVQVRNVGPILAAGQMATILANSAATQNQTGEDLESMLITYGAPQETASAYHTTVANGGVLLWVRSDESRSAEAATILRRHNGQHVMSN